MRLWKFPLSPESPGVVRRLANSKIEIVVDADVPFEEWLQMVPQKIQAFKIRRFVVRVTNFEKNQGSEEM